MKNCRIYGTVLAMTAALALSSSTAQAHVCNADDVSSRITPAFNRHTQKYTRLNQVLSAANVNVLRTQLRAVTNDTTYFALLGSSIAIKNASGLVNGRMLITLPDGTVVIDTARPIPTQASDCGATPADPRMNCFQNFRNKTINENHNSRLAVMDAQQTTCGLGIESKFSTSTNSFEHYLAKRLGPHSDNEGTARLSQN